MAGLGDLLGGGGAIEQLLLWGLFNQMLSSLLAPYLEQLAQDVNARHPDAVLSPADLAQAVVRNYLTADQGAAEAGKSGLDPERFAILTGLSGDAPAPGDLATALRRGLISSAGTGTDSTSFEQGIREGRLADKWIPMIRALAQQWPTPADALAAVLEGQVSDAEGKALYEKFGGDPDYFTLLFNTRGNAPTPVEALELANRGIIPWTGTGPDAISYEQAFLEGPWRNKWLKPYEALAEYVPPPETVRTLLEQGAITQQQASDLWAKQGLAPGTVQAYLEAAAFNQTAETRGLTMSAVIDMYYGQLIGEDEARSLLSLFHIPAANQDLLLAYADMRRSIAAVTAAVSRIQALYTARKIGRDTVIQSLGRLKIPASTVNDLVTTWDIEASVNVKTLTEAQIANAFAKGIMTQDDAMTEMEAIGYTPYDAWVLLSVKNGKPLPGKPEVTIAAPLGAVIPGVT
jgi:hypothetical protein